MASDQIIEVKPEFHSLGRIAFESYNAAGANPGKTFDGRAVPTWEALSDDVRVKWEAGACELFKRLERTTRIACAPECAEEVEELADLCKGLIENGMPSIAQCEQFEKENKS